MRTFLAIVTSLWMSLSALSQPFTPSDLGWPTRNSTSAADCSGVTATNSFVAMAENNSAPIIMHGLGGTFSVLSGPSAGSLSGLNTTAGTAIYTPGANFTGADSFVFQVQYNLCITNAVVSIGVFDTNSATPTCLTVTNVAFLDSGSSGCWTITTNGVVESSGCVTNSSFIPGTFSGSSCAYYSGCSLTTTNVIPFAVTASNPNYTNWVICNPDSVAHTYTVQALRSYVLNSAGGGIEMDITTNGVTALVLDSHLFGSPTSGSGVVSGSFSVGPNVINLPVRLGLVLNSSPPGSYSGTFTNHF